MKIHASQTGTVAVATAWREASVAQRTKGKGGARLAERRLVHPAAVEVAA